MPEAPRPFVGTGNYDWDTLPDGTVEVTRIKPEGGPFNPGNALWQGATHLVRQGNALVPAIVHDDARIERCERGEA